MDKILISFIFILMCIFQQIIAKTVMLADKYEVCYRSPQSPFSLNYMNIRYAENIGSYLQGEAYVSRDILHTEFKMTVGVTKCASREARDTCELFTTLKPQNSCKILDAKGTMWQKYVDGFEPPFKCPFRKGPIYAKNVTFEADLFSLFPLQNTYWELNMSFHTHNSQTASVCLGARFINGKN